MSEQHVIGHGSVCTSGGFLDVDALLKLLAAAGTLPSPGKTLTISAAPVTIDLGAIRSALAYADQNICRHEDLKRSGHLWTICCDCSSRWADDTGGFKPSAWPELYDRAMDLIERLEKEQAR